MEDAVTSEDAEPLFNASRNTDVHPREGPEPKQVDDCHPSSTSPELGSSSAPSSPLNQQTQDSAVSALQSKVKSLSERKVVYTNQDKRVVPGSFMLGYALTDAWGSSSSDDEMEPQKPRTCGSSGAMLASPSGLGEGASRENLSGTQEDQVSPCDRPLMPPKCFWRSSVPETPTGNGPSKMAPKFPRELQRSDSLESHLRRYNHGEVLQTGLWRADSLESVCSGGSSPTLAERVEMNRGLLRQMLQKAQIKNNEGDQSTNPEQRLEDPTRAGGRGVCGVNDSDLDSGISLQGSETSQRAFVLADDLPLSPRHEQAKRLLERARMKARSNPLKADHTILPVQRDSLELLSWVGVHQAGKECVASGNLSDSSSSDSAGGNRRRHGHSPTRVRFEDESEKDAEVRYLERLRQRRRAGERAQGLLVSKPNLSSYIGGQAETGYDSGSIFGKAKTRKSLVNGHHQSPNRQCNSCGTFLHEFPGASLNSNTLSLPPTNGEAEGKKIPCWVAPTLPNRLVRIEQIKETYIGTPSPVIVQIDETHCSPVDNANVRGTLQRLKKKVRKLESKQEPPDHEKLSINGTQMCLSNGLITLPQNPYATTDRCSPTSINKGLVAPPLPPKGETPFSHPQPIPPPLQPKKSALKSSSKSHSGGQRTVTLASSPEYRVVHLDSSEVGGAVESCRQEHPSAGLGYWEDRSVMVNPGPLCRTSPVMCAGNVPVQGEEWSQTKDVETHGALGSDATSSSAESTQTRLNDGHVRGPIKSVHQRATSPNLLHVGTDAEHREGRPKLSLRRFFSAMGLNSAGLLGKGRSSSMDQLSLHPKPSPNTNPNSGPASPSTSPSPTHRHQLKKAPSLQTIRLGSPFLQLRRSSSAQNLQIPKKKTDRSSAYSPVEQPCSPLLTRNLQRALSVEDVGRPSAVRSVGRVAQAFPDGTILLELSRPPNGPFGFLISRGKGRSDSGVYVEGMGDSNTEKLYAGLLGVGDEILEVNGEKVAGLSLDLVTRLMTQNSTASIRVLRHRRLQR
ncbi:uncharacterized protein KIAA1614 homolog isoform X1 [Misgurnus anguillicaudatus]|uniref:uncharacterized protein KIAA1614 homolog isoform X1 n=2 Tax=Misgurnus anguillicaudatus TaxID=75329 RepID=UPI003CCF1226